MSGQLHVEHLTRLSGGSNHRERLLAGISVTERRLQLAGVSTAVLKGGAGPPVVLYGPDDPPRDQPETLLEALRAALGTLTRQEVAG